MENQNKCSNPIKNENDNSINIPSIDSDWAF